MQACRLEKNVVRDIHGHLHLGKTKTVKRLFGKNATGAERYAKSESISVVASHLGCHTVNFCHTNINLTGQTLTWEEKVWSNSHQALVLHTQQQGA